MQNLENQARKRTSSSYWTKQRNSQVYTKVHKYLDTDAILLTLSLFANTMGLKLNNQDVIEV